MLLCLFSYLFLLLNVVHNLNQHFVMFGRIKHLNKLFIAGFIPAFKKNSEDVVKESKTAIAIAEENKNKIETGWDRLYMMFTTDEFGEPSIEIVNTGQVIASSFIIGCGIGGFLRSKIAFLNFVENNDATSFTSHLEAKQRLQDKVTMGFGKGAWQWGWRMAMFTGTYTIISTGISVYRGKDGIIEHVVAGCATGALYKVNLGLRGIIVGGTVGTILGTISGVSIWSILKLSGLTVRDIRKTGHKVQVNRQESFNLAMKEYLDSKEMDIVLQHGAKVGEGVGLDSIKVEK